MTGSRVKKNKAMKGVKVKSRQQRKWKFKQNISQRIFQYRSIKLIKTMKILLKKMKSKNTEKDDKSVKKLIKLRKWMDVFGYL